MRFCGRAALGVLGYCVCATSLAWCQQESDTVLHHAIQLHRSGDLAGAISEYRNYLNQSPDNVAARSNLGAALAAEGQFEDAIAEYRKALELQPANQPVRLNLALAYYKSAQIAPAATELERVVSAAPSERQPLLLLADCYLQLGQHKKVIDLLSPHEQDSPDDKAVDYMLGTALVRDNQTAHGQLLIDRLLRDGDSAEAHLLSAEAKMAALDFAGAIEQCKKAAQLNSRLPDLYGVYGLALVSMGELPEAEDAFRKELESDPNDYTANAQLGALLKQDENYPESRQLFDRALRVRPHDAAARYQLAILDLREGRAEQARAELESLVQENPRFVPAHITLATVYYKLKRKADGNHERAIVLRINSENQAASGADQVANRAGAPPK
jgi:tetratricopeptide (TPR) repeat protein